MTDLKNLKNINIYVLTCTKFAYLLGEFSVRFKKYFGFPFLVYVSDTDIDHWSDGVINFLNSIKDEYFILLHEDFYLTEQADLKEIDRLIGIARDMKADRVGLMGDHSPERTQPIKNNLYEYRNDKPHVPYHFSFEASIQRRKFLLEHLKKAENPWEAEINRNVEDCVGKIIVGEKPSISYGDKIRRGEIQEEIIDPNK